MEQLTDTLRRIAGESTSREVALDDLLDALVEESARALGADRGTLFLLEPATGDLVSRVSQGVGGLRVPSGDGLAGEVARTGAARAGRPSAASRRTDRATGYRTRTLLAAPVRAPDGRVVGVLELLNRPGIGLDDEVRAALDSVCGALADALFATAIGSQLTPGNPRPLSLRFNHIVGDGPAMRAVYARVSRAAPTTATVLIRGESGTGKELVARAVHYNSPRRDSPLVKVDCAALPETLIENELFGHERGAYTGADRESEGRVWAAQGGTLFLDEIAELSPAVQGKLLRLLQDRTYVRVGGLRERAADVRFVAATHVDLERRVAEGRFRADLYYRLRVVEIALPALRERGEEDLDRLADHLLHVAAERHGRLGLRLSDAARAAVRAHAWPGNVRELEHALEAAAVLCEGPRVEVHDLPSLPTGAGPGLGRALLAPDGVRPLAEVERDAILRAVEACAGNRSEAARRLGIGRNTLLRKLGERNA
jgi:Nif-specific regulatory protein